MEVEFQNLAIGGVFATVLINVFLRLIYLNFDVPNPWKPRVAVMLGVVVGVVAIYYNLAPGATVTFRMVVDHVIMGAMSGASAVGLYEMTQRKKEG